jgi:DNA helicase II / ATP-dependent DNA helicase PcrA
MVDLSRLNERQRKAVEWDEGPLLVLAGPGSGKTAVLTTRIARIIEATPDEHFRVLGLTFTNKAAAEMRKRIESLVPGANNRILLTTFPSYPPAWPSYRTASRFLDTYARGRTNCHS